jgi:hypothetical protein
MRIKSYTQLPAYEINGNFLNVYWDEQPFTDEDDQGWSYLMCRAYASDNYPALVVKIIRSQYSVDDEFASINDGGERHAEFLAFRDQAKALAAGRFA